MSDKDIRRKHGVEMLSALLKWAKVRLDEGFMSKEEHDAFRRALWLDAEHSLRGGLLERLYVHEEEPLPDPPPKFMSRPWYGVVTGEGENIWTLEVWVDERGDEPELVVGQHAWKLLERDESGQHPVYVATPIVGLHQRQARDGKGRRRTPWPRFRFERLSAETRKTDEGPKNLAWQKWRITRLDDTKEEP